MELPYPPTVNKYWTRSRDGRRILTPKARTYKDLFSWEIRLNKAFSEPIDIPVVVWIELYPPDNRVRDTDNTQKAIFDALQYARVITNDKLIVEHHVKMFPKRAPDGCIYVIMLDVKDSEWRNK